MKRIIFAVLALLPGLVLAAGGGFPLDKAEYDLSDKASLQRGAATFMNYCAGCHSTQYQRYNRVAADIGIPEELMKEHLVFTGAKIGDLMKSAMSEKDAARWFGAPPPTGTARAPPQAQAVPPTRSSMSAAVEGRSMSAPSMPRN